MPRDASVNGDGFRFYRWPGGDSDLHRRYNATEASDLLSVTSIRTLAGEPFQLVNWKVANVVNMAMGVRKATRIGPRGGVKEVYVKDGPFPGEFVTRMIESRGGQEKLDDNRKWLRQMADEPRDVAAVRGSVVHKLIEMRTPAEMVTEDFVKLEFDKQWARERRKVKPDLTEEDLFFVQNGMRQYEDMRVNVPFVVLTQEPQVFNLTVGFGGSADVLIWFLGTWNDDGSFTPLPGEAENQAEWQKAADAGQLTAAIIKMVGGDVAVGDWKTSKGVYTNHVLQTIAYMSGEFIGAEGIIDERLTQLLGPSMLGMVINIRPNRWVVDIFRYRQDAVRAFYGSVAFARFLALHKEPSGLFIASLDGTAPGTDNSVEVDDNDA